MAVCRTQQDLNFDALMRARVHPDATGLDGTGIVICVIDYGFDLLHPAFRTASGETRFAYLLDQSGPYLDRATINHLLRNAERTGGNHREALDRIYDPHANYYGRGDVQVGAHGSWVASIAAGSRTADFTGVAPNATLIGIQLDLPDQAWREEDENEYPVWLGESHHDPVALRDWPTAIANWGGWRSYENNAQLADSVHRAYELACGLNPAGIVINLSLGAWAGGHDAGSRVNQAISSVARTNNDPSRPMAYVVVATGNAGCDDGHVQGRLSGASPMAFTWSIQADATAQSKLEIWSDAPGGIDVMLTIADHDDGLLCQLDGSGDGVQPIDLGGNLIGIGENLGEVRNGLSAVHLLLHPALTLSNTPALPTRLGRAADAPFTFDVTVRARADAGGAVHAWIERDSSGVPQSRLILNAGNDPGAAVCSTLTPLACAPGVIGVAGLDTTNARDAALPMSGLGAAALGG